MDVDHLLAGKASAGMSRSSVARLRALLADALRLPNGVAWLDVTFLWAVQDSNL